MDFNLLRTIKLAASTLVLCVFISPVQAGDGNQPFRLIALGDMPYGDPTIVYPPYEALISTINDRKPDLVIHVGDTKGGGACSDEILQDQLNYMNMFRPPTLYTPGDNEWTY
jgi:hypothetical protein